jgi:hypothetical protein
MGGVIEVGLQVKCDRCEKRVPVVEEEWIKFYKDFTKNKENGDAMFACAMNGPDLDVAAPLSRKYEYMCPGCFKAVSGYINKTDKPVRRGRKKAGEDIDSKPPARVKDEADDEYEDEDDEDGEEEVEEAPKKVSAKASPAQPQTAAPARVKTAAKKKPEPEPDRDEGPDEDGDLPAIDEDELFD